MKQDGESRRKLSKRHDPEANVAYYEERGYPTEGVVDYLLNLANAAFEEWRKAHPTTDYKEFPFDAGKLNKSGALFDEIKLQSVCRDAIARIPLPERISRISTWAKIHDADLFAALSSDSGYTQAVIGIEEGLARKDLSSWSDVRTAWSFFFDTFFTVNPEALREVAAVTGKEDARRFLEAQPKLISEATDGTDWLGRIRTLATEMGYASGTKDFKQNPSAFKGHIGHLTQVVRVAVTGGTRSPDLFAVMKVLGPDRVGERCTDCLPLIT
jgi:glutamyl-tRNA synthetase